MRSIMSASSSLTLFYRVCLNSFPLFATKIWLYSPKRAYSLGSYDFFGFVPSSHCKICLIVPLCPRNPWETLTNSKLKQATFVSTRSRIQKFKIQKIFNVDYTLSHIQLFYRYATSDCRGGTGLKTVFVSVCAWQFSTHVTKHKFFCFVARAPWCKIPPKLVLPRLCGQKHRLLELNRGTTVVHKSPALYCDDSPCWKKTSWVDVTVKPWAN
jgi:hypothetical protein